jgi:hypothetical protein
MRLAIVVAKLSQCDWVRIFVSVIPLSEWQWGLQGKIEGCNRVAFGLTGKVLINDNSKELLLMSGHVQRQARCLY